MIFKLWKDLNKSWENVFRGAGSILEIQPTDDEEPRLYHPARTDLDALRGDWNRIGDDFRRALNKMVDDKKAK
jgi:hypothetical protein